MKIVKPETFKGNKKQLALKMTSFKVIKKNGVGNLPVWYDGVSEMIGDHLQPFIVDPEKGVSFVEPDGAQFTMEELKGYFGQKPEVVVVMIRCHDELHPQARIIHGAGKNRPANELATVMLMLIGVEYLLKPKIIKGPALFCHRSQIIL